MDIMPPDNQLPPHHAPTGLKLWLAVFGVVLVVALAYLVWASNTAPDTTDNSAAVTKKTIDETADWKTYANTDLGFSIKYPSTLSTDFTADTKTLSIDNGAVAKPNAVVMISVDTSTKSLDQFLADLKSGTIISGELKTTLDSLPAYEGIDLGIINHYGLYSVANGRTYILRFPTNSADTFAELKTGLSTTQKLMISSFKFTN